MNSIWFYLLILIPTLLGFLIGWFAGQAHLRSVVRKSAPQSLRPVQPPEPQPCQPEAEDDTCESVLEELQADIDHHSGKIQDLQEGLGPSSADTSDAVNDDLRRRHCEAKEANADLQAALSDKQERLLPFEAKHKGIVKEVLSRLVVHKKRTREFDASLDDFDVDDRSDGTLRSLVDQVTAVLEQNKQLQSQLTVAQQRVAEQEARLEVAEAEARFDVLTQLPNRRAFDEEFDRLQSLFNRHGHTFSVALFDVDRFKSLNDQFGHAAGDAVLKMFARVLRSCSRNSDHISRYGGEEFVVLFPHTSLDQAFIVTERYRRNIQAASLNFEGNRLKVTTSAGVAEFAAGESGNDLLVRADSALYDAKQSGRNRTCRSILTQQPEDEAPAEVQSMAAPR